MGQVLDSRFISVGLDVLTLPEPLTKMLIDEYKIKKGGVFKMGYTIFISKPKRKLLDKEVRACVLAINDVVDANLDIVEYGDLSDLFVVSFNGKGDKGYETFSFNAGTLKNGECIKTAGKEYDKVVKECLIKMQWVTKNAFDIHCDDGFIYTDKGLVFCAKGLYKEYQPIDVNNMPVLQLKDLPYTYTSKGKGRLRTGEYSWNESLWKDIPLGWSGVKANVEDLDTYRTQIFKMLGGD